jgi:hypothetical protein
MKLLVSQKNLLADLIENVGLSLTDFKFMKDKVAGVIILLEKDNELLFNFRDTIQDAEYCDVYYKPTNKLPSKHIHMSINSFEEAIPYFIDWLDCLSLEANIVDKWRK